MGIVYCYRTRDDLVVERMFQMGHAPAKVTLPNGEVAQRDYQSEARGMMAFVKDSESPCRTKPKAPWPMECTASAVHPSQAKELRKHLRDRGCPTEVTPGGEPVYISPAHRKKALKIRGFQDKAAYS